MSQQEDTGALTELWNRMLFFWSSPKAKVLRILKNFKPNYYNEKFLIKDKNGNTLKKSENLNQLIDKTSWNNLRLLK